MKVKHEGLRQLAETGSHAGVPPHLAPRLRRILSALQHARRPADLADNPGFRLHPLRGGRRGVWASRASGNWRVTFRFDAGEAVDVDLVDYH